MNWMQPSLLFLAGIGLLIGGCLIHLAPLVALGLVLIGAGGIAAWSARTEF